MGSNKDLKKNRDGTFNVSEQLDIYSRQYTKYSAEIVKQYRVYIEILNKLLDLNYDKPKGLLDSKAGLAIFTDDKEVDKDLIRLENPFIGTYQPAVSVALTDIWDHFAGAKGEAYNVADEQSDITIRELAELLAAAENKKVVFDIDEANGNTTPITRATFSTEKLARLGWQPRTTIAEGLAHTLAAQRLLR